MRVRTHGIVREGLIVGVLGALTVACWYFLVDLVTGQPLRMPSVLGQVLVRGDRRPDVAGIDWVAVVGYTAVHFAMFAILGVALIRLVHMASRDHSLRMGVWMGFVLTFAWLVFHTYALTPFSGYRTPAWVTVIGAIAGVSVMGLVTWRRHPGLRQSLRDAPLADEVEAPPAPPTLPEPPPSSRHVPR